MYAKELAQLPSHKNTLVTNENQELVMVYETLQICLRLRTPFTPQPPHPITHTHPAKVGAMVCTGHGLACKAK